MSSVPDPQAAEPIPDTAVAEVLAMLGSGDLFRYTSGTDSAVSRLEREFAAFLDAPYALAVNSCSSALFLSMKALGLRQGDRVAIPAFTFAAVPSAIVHAGCAPVLVNVGDNYRINLDDFEAKLSQDVKAVIISHMRGHTSDMDAILWLCEARGVPVIEDAAHSLGTTWSGQLVGGMGDVGCFSFQSYKLVNAGEGGILTTRDADVFARAVIMSGAYEHNWRKHPAVNERFEYWQNRLPLYNMRMNNLAAAVARAQIGDVARRARVGRENHDHLAALLNASPWLEVPPPLPQEARAPDSIQFNLRGFDADEDALAFHRRALDKGVQLQIIGLSKDNARAFWNWSFIDQPSDLGPTRDMLRRACDVRLPVQMRREDLDFIGAALIDAAAEVMSGGGARAPKLRA